MINAPLPEETSAHSPGQNAWGQTRARIISFVSQKGGVGKTTSAVNLGAAFALSGHRVLLVGLDPQCGLSRSLGYMAEDLRGGLRDVLSMSLPIESVIHETSLENLHLVSPDANTLSEEEEYKAALADHVALDELLARIGGEYDTILIDCPPGFGPETKAALCVSESYLVPVQAEELCRDSLTRLMHFIQEFEPYAHRGLRMEGMFLTMTDTRTRMSRLVTDRLVEEFGEVVYETPVPRTTRLAEMAIKGRPTVIFDRRSTGSRAYFNLLDEIMLRHLHAQSDELEAVDGGLYGEDPDDDDDDRSERPQPRESGLSRLLQDAISASGGRPAPQTYEMSLDDFPEIRDEDEPDLVSLDDLLDEEERAGRSRREQNDWGFDDDALGSIN